MINAQLVPLGIDRGSPRVFTIQMIGIDLTGADLHAQIRLTPDAPGDPLLDLPRTTDPTAPGVRLISVDTTATLPSSFIRVQIPAMQTGSAAGQLPAAAEVGDDVTLYWDMFIKPSGRTIDRWFYGPVPVVATVTKMASLALVDDPLPGVDAVATLQGPDLTVSISGAALIEPLLNSADGSAGAAIAAAQQADGFRQQAQDAAATAQQQVGLALPKAGGVMAGNIDFDGHNAVGMGDAQADGDGISRGYAKRMLVAHVATLAQRDGLAAAMLYNGQLVYVDATDTTYRLAKDNAATPPDAGTWAVATTLEDTLKGGYRSVADVAARNAIPNPARKAGMRVKVLGDDGTGVTGRDFVLGGDLSNTGWTGLPTSAELRDRSTHTGTQSADTLVDGTAKVAMTAAERAALTNVGMLDPLEYDRSGYRYVQVDANFRVLLGILPTGSIPLQATSLNAGGQAVGYLDTVEYGRSGYIKASVDANFRILDGTPASLVVGPSAPVIATGLSAGGQSIGFLDALEYGRSGYYEALVDANFVVLTKAVAKAVPATSTSSADTLYEIVELVDGSNKSQTFASARATGKLTQLSPAGSNNVPRALRPDGWVTYKSDRASPAPGGLYASNVLTGALDWPVMPIRRMVSIGDSLAAASYIAGSSYQEVAAAQLGLPCDVFGINGQSARQIAARWGAQPMFVTLASNTLLGSGETAITLLTENPITGSVAGKIHVRVGATGPYAVLKRTAGGDDAQAYVLVQDAGGADVAVTPRTRLYPDQLSLNNNAFKAYHRDSLLVISATRNGNTAIDEIIAELQMIVATQQVLTNRFLIALCLPGCDPADGVTPIDGYGTANRAVIDLLNNRIKALWPDNWYDILPWLQAQSDGSANDTADVAAGVSPRSTRLKSDGTYDQLHPIASARAAIGPSLAALITSKGWTL